MSKALIQLRWLGEPACTQKQSLAPGVAAPSVCEACRRCRPRSRWNCGWCLAPGPRPLPFGTTTTGLRHAVRPWPNPVGDWPGPIPTRQPKCCCATHLRMETLSCCFKPHSPMDWTPCSSNGASSGRTCRRERVKRLSASCSTSRKGLTKRTPETHQRRRFAGLALQPNIRCDRLPVWSRLVDSMRSSARLAWSRVKPWRRHSVGMASRRAGSPSAAATSSSGW